MCVGVRDGCVDCVAKSNADRCDRTNAVRTHAELRNTGLYSVRGPEWGPGTSPRDRGPATTSCDARAASRYAFRSPLCRCSSGLRAWWLVTTATGRFRAPSRGPTEAGTSSLTRFVSHAAPRSAGRTLPLRKRRGAGCRGRVPRPYPFAGARGRSASVRAGWRFGRRSTGSSPARRSPAPRGR